MTGFIISGVLQEAHSCSISLDFPVACIPRTLLPPLDSVDQTAYLSGPDARNGLERLARTLLRAPIGLERLSFDATSDQVAYAR